MPNRKAAEKVILSLLQEWCPGNPNISIYENLFKSMTDKAFDALMVGIEQGTSTLAYIEPNLTKGPRVGLKGNLKFIHKLGHEPFQKIWMHNTDGSRTLSNYTYLVLPLPLRRQAQHLVKKISIPKNNRTVDDFTGQPTGDSKGSKLTYPEVGVLDSLGLKNTLEELLVYRGGDTKGFAAMNSKINDTGSASFEEIEDRRSGVESVKTMSVFLKAAHIGNNLNTGN